MFKNRSSFRGNTGLKIRFVFFWSEFWLLDKRDRLIQDRRIPGNADVERSHKGKPEEIVRNARAYSSSSWRMPPVLDVAFLKLVFGREQDLFTRNVGTAVNKGHDVLQLIAETKRTSRLVKRSPCAHATRKRLEEQPAIKHCVECQVGSFDFYGAKQQVPATDDFLESFIHFARLTICSNQFLSTFSGFCFASNEDNFTRLMW